MQGRADPSWLAPMAGFALAGVAPHILPMRQRALRLAYAVALVLIVSVAVTLWRAATVALSHQIVLFAAIFAAGVGQLGVASTRSRLWRMAARLAVGCVVAALALMITEQKNHVPTPADRPRLAILTSLPLRFQPKASGTGSLLDGFLPAPILTMLETQFQVDLRDSVDASSLARTDILLLAQPRALPPETLVDIDAWVRRGGQTVVLADLQLDWPSGLPLGDARAPVPVSLLSSLLDHWGVHLVANADTSGTRRIGEVLDVNDSGERLRLFSAARWRMDGAQCQLTAGDIVARCRIGRGGATLIADADFLHHRLWQGASSGEAIAQPLMWDAGSALWLSNELRRRAGAAPTILSLPPVWAA